MNSVSMPRRPVSRARRASSPTTVMQLRTLLAGPVTVTVEVLARGVLGVALAVAAGADAEQHVDEPDRQPGADDPQPALPAIVVGPQGDGQRAADHDDRRKPDAHERGHGSNVQGSVG